MTSIVDAGAPKYLMECYIINCSRLRVLDKGYPYTLSPNGELACFFCGPCMSYHFGAGKQVLKSKGSLTLSVTDPFRIQKRKV